ncbi:YolD-like family protein [Bacillus sp. 1P06AnD]|uniref:YolD-like family protein n=1 Tax=Bacillus sp. 1P06AnD TaxID=3132208 RepID=UPI00399EF7C4
MGAVPKPPSKKKTKAKRPERDEYELEEIAMQLNEAKDDQENRLIIALNQEEPIKGKVTHLDPVTKQITISYLFEKYKVHFLDILKIERLQEN